MKLLLMSLLFAFLSGAATVLHCQDKASIIKSGQYLYAETFGTSEINAKEGALHELNKHIAKHFNAYYKKNLIGSEDDLLNNSIKVVSSFNEAIDTYSGKFLSKNGSTFECFYFIKKSELPLIFADRIKIIRDIYAGAELAENELNLGYALKWYYFAYLLRQTIPLEDIVFQEIDFSKIIPEKLIHIINTTFLTPQKLTQSGDGEKEFLFNIKKNNLPVRLIELVFSDNNTETTIRAIDGEGVVRIGNGYTGKIELSIKYDYSENRDEVKELSPLWDIIIKPRLEATKYLSLPSLTEEKVSKASASNPNVISVSDNNFGINLTNTENCPVLQKIASETLILLNIIKSGSIKDLNSTYSADNFIKDKITSLIKYNKPSIIGQSIDADINKTLTGWELRKISILNKYSSIKKQSKEYLVLDFDHSGNLYDVSFGVLRDNYDVVKKESEYSKDWLNRLTILKFIEKYRTCFLCRDINTLDSLFSEQAVIIVGRILKKSENKDMAKYIKLNKEQPEASYIQYTAKEYLSNLGKLFNRTPDLFIGFGSIDISRKNGNESVYGISMRQNYYSTGYSDEGYLFLLVDFYYKLPQIYVRTWQPGEWSDDAIVKLSNYTLNR